MQCVRFGRGLMLLASGLFVVVGAVAADTSAWPCIGRPAILVPGGQFGVGDVEVGTVFLLLGGARIEVPVVPDEKGLYGGVGVVSIPASLAPGRYDLAVSGVGGESVRRSAVHIVAGVASNYSIALLRSDIGVDDVNGTTLFSPALLDRVGAASVNLVFVLGRLTRDGQMASYAALTRQFSAFSMPIIFCPDQGELLRGIYKEVFGDPVYPFRYGEDGFLVLGAGMAGADSGVEARMGPVYRWRRALRACRWSTGVTGRFGLDWTMRSQLTLFVDDPLDYLIAGEIPTGFGEKVPWGQTRFLVGPSVAVESLQVIDVDDFEMTLRE